MSDAQRRVLRDCFDQWEASVAALQDSETRIRAVLDTTVDGIITIDTHGIVRSFNPAAEKIFGYPATDVIGRNVSTLMPETQRTDHDEILAAHRGVDHAPVSDLVREVVGLRKNGETFPLELAVSDVKVGNDRTFTGIVRDVSERKKMDQALQDERNFVTAILNTAGALILVLDGDARVIRFNRACEQATGCTLEEVRGSFFWDRLVPEDDRPEVQEIFFRLLAGRQRTTFDGPLITADGQRQLVSWSVTTLGAKAGEADYVVCIGIDITERRRAEEALVSIGEDVRREIGRELHDALGQQLTGLSLLTKALELRLAETAQTERQHAAEITALARTAVAEVRRLAHGLYPVELERHGLEAALAELADSTTRHQGPRCRFQRPSPGEPLDKTVALHLFRIAQEAVNNAVKHSDAEDIIIDLSRKESSHQLVIQDNGKGMVDPAPLRGAMGLAIMRYRARLIGAVLDVQSMPGEGTRVLCRIRGGRPFGNQGGTL